MRCRFRGSDSGQMVVELAVVTPVMLAIAVIVVNLMWFMEATARFDRIAPDLVMAHATSPAGVEPDAYTGVSVVSAGLTSAMEGFRGVAVSVSAYDGGSAPDAGGGVGFSISPHLTTYVCVMEYTPWPSSLTVAGIDAGIPLVIEHRRTITVDRYRPGIVI